MNKIYILKVFKNSINKIVALDINVDGVLKRISIDQLAYLKNRGYNIENAILCRNGVIRAKKGRLNIEYISDIKQTNKIKEISLDKYKNKKTYDGNTVKFGITYKGIDYIVKPPKNKDYSMYSEDVASRFMRGLGYNAHETLLVKDTKRGDVVLLKDFVRRGESLRSYKSTGQSSEDTNVSDKSYTYDDIVYMINKHTKISDEHKKQALEQFWDMYMLDAILGNRDRHHGNWGYICKGNEYRITKIYDNGASLFPNVNNKMNEYKKEKRNKRTNYYEYIGNYKKYKEMEIAYNKIKNIGLEKIYDTIKAASNNELIPELLRKFYIDIVCIRYMHIIERLNFDECYRRLLDVCK